MHNYIIKKVKGNNLYLLIFVTFMVVKRLKLWLKNVMHIENNQNPILKFQVRASTIVSKYLMLGSQNFPSLIFLIYKLLYLLMDVGHVGLVPL